MLTSENFKKAYEKLNPEQKKAVDTIEGPVLVVAGPGSGKTEILSLRVGNILLNTDTRASNILCLTFTESAASNMRDRLAKLIGAEAYHIAIYTFHSFAIEIMRRYPEYFYGGAFFTPADPVSQIDVLEAIIEDLPHENPLRSFHPDQGFVYRSAIQSAIRDLKSAGLSPDAFCDLLKQNKKDLPEINNILQKGFSERLSLKSIQNYKDAVQKLAGLKTNLAVFLVSTLSIAVGEAEEMEKTLPLSAWKEKFLKKDDNGNSVLKDTLYIEKLESLSEIYGLYQKAMHQRGFYDFDDMLLDVIVALENNSALRYEIQEQFQYILIDEFQDTNNAQMKIISLVTDAPVHEGRPNVMAVGDDDQAVYKFQGAEISNILEFSRNFTDPEIITMTGNYRSSQQILDLARKIIVQGEDRLEKRIKGMDKSLKALGDHASNLENVTYKSFPTKAHEYTWVAKKVRSLLEQGIAPESIALITRKHAELTEIVPFLKTAGVPIKYEREQNVFEEPHIKEIIVIAQFLAESLSGNIETADSFLPTILSFPFWQIPRELIWNISVQARKNHTSWLSVMSESKEKPIEVVYNFLLEALTAAQYEPLEKALDRIIGAHVPLLKESEDEPEEGPYLESAKAKNQYASPFRDFYFSRRNFEEKRAEYLSFLSSLRVFVAAVREYKQGQVVGISDLVEFVEIHNQNNIPLHDRSPFASSIEAVSLMTAHKAKGLEFDQVFILSCQQDVWASRGRGSRLPFPTNLPITPAGDNSDDQLRLFYVALTRAKQSLYLSSFDTDEKGSPSSKLGFLTETLLEAQTEQDEIPDTHDVLTAEWLSYHTPPFFGEERAVLSALLVDYQMSVTHLNNFLDITKGGPQYFLEQNLLRFPQAKTVSSSFGTVVHKTIEYIYTHLKSQKKLPELQTVIEWFTVGIKRERLAPADEKVSLSRGERALTAFYEHKKEEFNSTHRIEVDFTKQGVNCSETDTSVCIGGKIDKMVITQDEIVVHDFKTGKPKISWQGSSDHEKIQLRNYARQLIFYKILVEGSRDYSKYKVRSGVLEFVEPIEGADDSKKMIDLSLGIEEADTERLRKLICAVHKKIINLEFPDISKYEKNIHGVIAFEEDLLSEA